MNRIVSVAAALQCAVQTLAEQPREVPAAPAGWAEKAQAALDARNDEQVGQCAREILTAHSQYRAEFDIKGWLFDLRNAVHSAPAHRAATAAISRVISEASK